MEVQANVADGMIQTTSDRELLGFCIHVHDIIKEESWVLFQDLKGNMKLLG